jgi:hypothetical protein
MKKLSVLILIVIAFAVYSYVRLENTPKSGEGIYIRDLRKGFVVIELIDGKLVERNTKKQLGEFGKEWSGKIIYRAIGNRLVETPSPWLVD